MTDFEQILEMIVNAFTGIFDFILKPATDFLNEYSSGFSEFLLNLMDWAGFTDFMSTVSFGGLLFGAALPVVVTILIVYFFIP